MSNVTVVRISGGPESLYANLPALSSETAALTASPRGSCLDLTDSSTVTFTNGRVTLQVDGSDVTASPPPPRRPQRAKRRTQLVHHRDRHLRQEVKTVRYLPSPKVGGAPLLRLSSATSDAATSTDVEFDASVAASSVSADSSDWSGGRERTVDGVDGSRDLPPRLPDSTPPVTNVRYKLSLAEQYQNQLFNETGYVIRDDVIRRTAVPAAGGWAAGSDAHDSGLEGSESDGTGRKESTSDVTTDGGEDADVTRSDVTVSDVTDGTEEEELAVTVSAGTAEATETTAAAQGEEVLTVAAAPTVRGAGLTAAADHSQDSGYVYIPAKEQREREDEYIFVAHERIVPPVGCDDDDGDAADDPGYTADGTTKPAEDHSRKISDATTVDRHFYFGESVGGGSEDGREGGSDSSPVVTISVGDGESSRLTQQNLKLLEELQNRAALPESFLAFKQALLDSGDMSGLRKADLYTVLGGTVRGYPASWDDLGSKFEEPASHSDEVQEIVPEESDERPSGVSIDNWTVDRRGRYRAAPASNHRDSNRPSLHRPGADSLFTERPNADSHSWYPLCERCGDMVYPQDGVRTTTSVYHVACVRCGSCDQPLDRDELRVAEGAMFCAEHAPAGAYVSRRPSRRIGAASSNGTGAGQDPVQVPVRATP